jgi:hypothetical protein
MRSAAIAAVLTTLACYPRLAAWQTRVLPIWYLALSILLASFFLWSFVLGWQGKHGGADPLQVPRSPGLWAAATAFALAAAALNHWFLDPRYRAAAPEEFASDIGSWLAMTLFSLAFSQLFTAFAPLAFFLRLVPRRWLAIALTLAFGLLVMSMKVGPSNAPPPPGLLVELIIVRPLSGAVLLYFYMKGGLPLAWWISLLVQARHLPGLQW